MNRNDIFEYDIELAPPDDPSVAKKNLSQDLVPQQSRRSDSPEKPK